MDAAELKKAYDDQAEGHSALQTKATELEIQRAQAQVCNRNLSTAGSH